MVEPLTRRRMVSVATACATAGAAIFPALAAYRTDAELSILGRELESVHAARVALDAANSEGNDTALYDRHWALREAINLVPATNTAGLKVKARAAKMAFHYDPCVENEGDGSYAGLSASLIEDLLKMSTGGLHG